MQNQGKRIELAAQIALDRGRDLPEAKWAVHLCTVARLLAMQFPRQFAPHRTTPPPALCMSREARVHLLMVRHELGQSLWNRLDRLPGMESEGVVRIIHHDQRNGSDRIGAATTWEHSNDDKNADESARRTA